MKVNLTKKQVIQLRAILDLWCIDLDDKKIELSLMRIDKRLQEVLE